MKCIICNESTLLEGTLEQIMNIKKKKQKVEERINSATSSDMDLYINLIAKSKRHEDTINRLEKGSLQERKLICYSCFEKIKHLMGVNATKVYFADDDEADFSKLNEMLKIIKICSFMIWETKSNIFSGFEDLLNDEEDSLIVNILKDPMNCEYYEAKLYCYFKYYKEALLLLEKKLSELEKNEMRDVKDARKYLSDEQFEDYLNNRDERKNDIKDIIYEIKEKLELT